MTSCDDMASKRQLKLDNFHVIQKKWCDDVESEVSGPMEHSGEFSESTSDEHDYSDCDEQGDKSDPEPYNYILMSLIVI